jgi:hypothetical protein
MNYDSERTVGEQSSPDECDLCTEFADTPIKVRIVCKFRSVHVRRVDDQIQRGDNLLSIMA